MVKATTTLYDIIERQDDRAIAIAAPDRQPLAFGGLRDLIDSTVERLGTFGIGRQDRLAIVLPNGPEMAAAFVALASRAAVAPLNPTYTAVEFRRYITDLDVAVLVVQSGDPSPARDAAAEVGIPIIELSPRLDGAAGTFDLEISKPLRRGVARAEPPGEGDVALVLHTSGTTSRPKRVPLTQANICLSAVNVAESLNLCAADRCLNIMPLFHIHGLIACVLAPLAAGGSVYCCPGFNALKFFGWLQASAATWYSAVPSMHQAILERAARNQQIIRQSSLRLVRSCSAALAPAVIEHLEAAFECPVVEAYGMTEAAHQIACNPLPPAQRKAGTVGVAAGPEMAIMDTVGKLVPEGGEGEIVIRGPNVMPGYEDNLDANAQSFSNGWFRTGDQGSMDGEGYLTISARLKELINRGGEKIAPREIDEVLLDHPAVSQAIAFAVPDRRLGEDVAAAVVLRDGAEINAKDLQVFAAGRLAKWKVPKRIVFVDQIPTGPTGKLQRIGLAEALSLSE
jgi:acyl-CoA synthetase (AMP-forming)/AMP-acid ligase II